MERNSELEQERREERRRRRRRSQIGAYAAFFAIVAVLATGAVFGVKYIMGRVGDKETEPVNVNQTLVEEMLGTEETLEEPVQPAETEPEMTPEQKLDEIVDAAISEMPLEHKVAGLFFVTPESITGVSTAVQAGEGTQTALAQYPVGGIVYFTKNIQSEEQLKQMIANTKEYSIYPLFIGVDEEGGTVSRIAEAGLVQNTGSAQTIGQSGDAANAYNAGTTIGACLASMGFNLDFAPVADLANVENSVMADRSYGSDAAAVIPYVNSMMQGLEEQGVTACLKHFPGIGSTTEDTHEGLASTDRSESDFRANEFAVFQSGIDAGAHMIMVSHMAAPALTGDNTPCSMSKIVITDILRNEMNFRGVIISDAMNMAAISDYNESSDAAIMALKAGCDMILMPEDFVKAYNGVLAAVQNGTISEERINDSLRRIYRIKYADMVE